MPEQLHGGVLVTHTTLNNFRVHKQNSHTEHVLSYLVDGWFEIEHGGRFEVEPGSVTIIPAGVPHRPLAARNAELWIVVFCATCMGLDESQLLMSPFARARQGALPVVQIPKSRRRKLQRLCREIQEECECAAPESPELVRSLLLLILGEIRRSMSTSVVTAVQGSLVSDALEFIQKRCLKSISLKDVAAAVSRTPAHVTTTVKKETGYSVGQWITSGRVAEAAKRLAHTDDSLDAIAGHVGWQDKTHFIRQFRKAYGVTPAAWRRQCRQSHSDKSSVPISADPFPNAALPLG